MRRVTGFTANTNNAAPRSRPPTPRSTSAASSPRSTASPRPASPRSTPPPARGRHRASTTTLSGGIGVNGALTVQQLKLTHDNSKLLVVHTGRQIDGQDRYGVGIIDTATKQLLPVAHPAVGRQPAVRRRHPAHLRRRHRPRRLLLRRHERLRRRPPADQRHRGRLPARPAATTSQPLWISRCFDSVYSVAITEKARLPRRPLPLERVAHRPRPVAGPRQRRLRHRPGPRRATASATQVVRRDHIGALDPATGKALEWNPGLELLRGQQGDAGHPARPVRRRRRHDPGRRPNVGRVAFYDFNTVPRCRRHDTTITTPIEGRVDRRPTRRSPSTAPPRRPAASRRVQVECRTATAASTSRTT